MTRVGLLVGPVFYFTLLFGRFGYVGPGRCVAPTLSGIVIEWWGVNVLSV